MTLSITNARLTDADKPASADVPSSTLASPRLMTDPGWNNEGGWGWRLGWVEALGSRNTGRVLQWSPPLHDSNPTIPREQAFYKELLDVEPGHYEISCHAEVIRTGGQPNY